jgi:hypothetical protein
MSSTRAFLLCCCLCLGVALPASAKDKKAAGGAKPSTAGKSASPPRLQLEEKSDTKGFTIKVPSQVDVKGDEWSTTYKGLLPPDFAQFSATVTIESLDEFTPVTNLDKAVEAVINRRPKGGPVAVVAEQKVVPNGYMVVIGPDYGVYSVDVIRNGKEIQVKAHCSGPGSHMDDLKQICLSVKPSK